MFWCWQVCFNTQPPEGGWLGFEEGKQQASMVSTHSRLKAAGTSETIRKAFTMFQHTAA